MVSKRKVRGMRFKNKNDIRLHNRFIISCKKNTIAVFLSFVLTLILLTTILVMLHTNHRIDNIQSKTEFTPSDCYIADLSIEQIEQLRTYTCIERLAVEKEGYVPYERNNKSIFVTESDDQSITMMSAVIDGRLPQKKGEVAAEKWVLLNLGIEPAAGRKFVMKNYHTEESEEFIVTGILSDMFGHKKYGTLDLYTSIDKRQQDQYIAYIKFKESTDYDSGLEKLRDGLGISQKQIKECPAREDFKGLYQTDVKVILVIFIVCMVVFYGVYRTASITRGREYGILRAVGMKKSQLQKMILLELYQIYFASVPVGIGIGLLISYFIMVISGDKDLEIYLYNERVEFHIIVPILQIFICAAVLFLFIGIVGYIVGSQVNRSPVMELISGNRLAGKARKSIFALRASGGKYITLFQMSCKYIFKDLKTSILAALMICVGITLFSGLVYKAYTLKVYRDDTREMWYLNGQYAISGQYFDSYHGISRKTVEDIKRIPNIVSVKTAAGVPIRVIDDESIARNDKYYDDFNRRLKEIYNYTDSGYDGKDQVYKSVLYGYNKEALESLKKHVITGRSDLQNMGEDEVVLSVYRTDDTKENENPGSYRDGTPLMEYKAGDEIRIKYRTDFKTDSYEYEAFADSLKEYEYQTYKIAAIVSFPYMRDYNMTEYPLLITKDENIRKIAPNICCQCIYADGKEDMSIRQQILLERQLIQICNQDAGVSTRSLIMEIQQNEMFYQKQMIYVYGIAAVSFILVMINMMNNLKYRMQTRTREICMLRAVGMSVAMTKKIMLFENIILGAAGIAASLMLTHPVLKYLYKLSDLKAFGHVFRYPYAVFGMLAAWTLFVCVIISLRILKSWKSRQIIEGIGKSE